MSDAPPITEGESRGRPKGSHKLDAQKIQIICQALSRGATRTLAAASAGVSGSVLRGWLTRGEMDHASENLEDEQSIFAELYLKVIAAEFEAAGRWLDMVSGAAPQDWRAAAWLLERRHPQDFGRQVHELQGGDPEKPLHTTPLIVEVFKTPRSADDED
jgi:transposase-like protein